MGDWMRWTLWTLSRLTSQVRRVKKPRRAMTTLGVTSHAWKRQSSHAMGIDSGKSTSAPQPQGRKKAINTAARSVLRARPANTARQSARGWAGSRVACQGSVSATGTARWKMVGSSSWVTMGTTPSA